MTTQISSSELQLLIFRYLKESGFDHSAYVFAVESSVASSEAATADLPPGSLVSIVHKGLLFSQLEKEVDEPNKKAKLSAANEIADAETAASSGVLVLKGHQSAVYACNFHPKDGNLLATGAGDAFARIWKLVPEGKPECVLLEHSSIFKSNDDTSMANESSSKHDTSKIRVGVPTLAWSPDGTLLATGCIDGRIRLWTKEGESTGSLIQHTSAVFAVKFSRSGKLLASGGSDEIVLVWDASSKTIKRTFEVADQTLDLDWRPELNGVLDETFAVCGGKLVHICRLSTGDSASFEAHSESINAVKWNSTGTHLATCSEDKTVKIWNFSVDTFPPPCISMTDHTSAVYTLRWSPCDADSTKPERSMKLVTVSYDATIKLWNAADGSIIHNMKQHTAAVYAVEFDFNGDFLLSGAADKFVHVWNVESGTIVKSHKLTGGVFDVSWNVRGDKYAAALTDSTVAVMDF